MIYESIRDADDETEVRAFINDSGKAILTVDMPGVIDAYTEFVFEGLTEIDWLIDRLKGIRQEFIKFHQIPAGPDDFDFTQVTQEEATRRFAELKKSISAQLRGEETK